ncbi:MAG: effector binding domain-containing protein [Clostridia bacterium]|nr:effector binding domain-containing protein [Clostridia bacterium]
MLSVCGLLCSECDAFGESCGGCIEVAGRPSWTKDVGIDACELFECSANRGFDACGECDSVPCKRMIELRDPRVAAEAHIEEVRARVGRLRSHQSRSDREIQVRQLDEITFVGFALRTSVSAPKDVIPRFWDEFWQTGKAEALRKALGVCCLEPLYGVCACYDSSSGAFTYLAGAKLPQGNSVPDGFDSVTLCPSLYGVVHLPMDVPQIQAAWGEIHAWGRKAGFEVGPEGFESYPDESTCDVCVQIR